MEKFIVSARKYRPQNFSTVVGQAHITTTLKNAIKNNQLAHAFLFCGPRGVGKTTCARILAKTINCENRTEEGEACNTCNSCVSFDAGTSLNIHELDAASNNSVDDIRALVEQVRFAPQAGKYKVYIVDEVHMLSASAFNAFLKTLEEPPPFAIFILATTEKHKILPTILSRCQIFEFKRITNTDTIEHLEEICQKEDIKAERAALHTIAQKSEGCMRDSLSILDKIVSFTNGEITYQNTLEHLNILDEDYYFKLLDYFYQQDTSSALLLFDEINKKGFEGDIILNGLSEFLRNLLISGDAKVVSLLEVAEDFKEKYFETAKRISPAYIVSALNILNEAELNFKQARNKRLHIELTMIKLCYLLQAVELVDNGGLEAKKKVTNQFKTVSFKLLPTKENNSPKGSKDIPVVKPVAAAKLEIEKPITKQYDATVTTSKATSTEEKKSPEGKTKPGLGSLNKIREQIIQQNQFAVQASAIPLSHEKLIECWDLFIGKLQQQNNHPAVTNFKLAQLQIVDDNLFKIIIPGEFQKAFIEGVRSELILHIQKYFNNRSLVYQLVVQVQHDSRDIQPIQLNSKEQFNRLANEYPMVKELKERLKLDLDY